jgi:hypothetical protein
MQILQHACQIAKQNAQEQGIKYKENFDASPEFQFDWISPEAPAICWPANFNTFFTSQPDNKPALQLPPANLPPLPQEVPQQDLVQLPVHTPPPIPPSNQVLCDRKTIDYRELHTGI